jgi:hypothetical protein
MCCIVIWRRRGCLWSDAIGQDAFQKCLFCQRFGNRSFKSKSREARLGISELVNERTLDALEMVAENDKPLGPQLFSSVHRPLHQSHGAMSVGRSKLDCLKRARQRSAGLLADR